MKKFCGNCGTPIEENIETCKNCGVILEPTDNKKWSSNFVGSKSKKRSKVLNWVVGAVSLIIVLTIVINIVSGFTGYKGSVGKIMNAYKTYDIETLANMASSLYELDEYSSYSDNYAENLFSDRVEYDLNYFEDKLGHTYDISYKIIDEYEMSKWKIPDFFGEVTKYDGFDELAFQTIMVVEVEITAKSASGSYTKTLEIYLSKEFGSWKLLYLFSYIE